MLKQNTYTFTEIAQQPGLWLKVADLVLAKQKEIEQFLKPIFAQHAEVIFTGAGSSYFIGEMVAPIFQKDTQLSCRAIETTEIVTHPEFFLNKHKKTLLVSFARSGNSPESLAAVELADTVSENVMHLIITCNKDGALAQFKKQNTYVFVLPPEANDKSLAMTSSVTSMALVALLIGRMNHLASAVDEVKKAAHIFEKCFVDISTAMKEIDKVDYKRAIFLGSGAMKGTAREAHLKLQELTSGDIVGKFDSFLGFRHGPKAVVNDKTLIVYLFSNDEYVRQYQLDLVEGMSKSPAALLTVGINNTAIDTKVDKLISLSDTKIDNGIWSIVSLVPIQLLAYYKSKYLGYNPDSPSKNGAIHRVVQGVTIYQYHNNIANNNGQATQK